MTKKIIPIVFAVALAASLFAASCIPEEGDETSSSSITIVDSAGRTVEVPQPLERIATSDSGTAEVIRALGATDKIVGIADHMVKYDYFWPELQDRPIIGSFSELDLEKVIDIEPQVLFTVSLAAEYEPPDMEEQLEAAGIKVIRMDFHEMETAATDIRTVGLILGKEEEAEEFANFLQSKIDFVEEVVEEIEAEERKMVYLESGYTDYTAHGPGSTVDELLDKAGGINIFADLGVTYSEVDPEEILVRDFDVVIKCAMGAKYGGYTATDTSDMEALRNEMMSRPGWSELEAVQNGQVYIEGRDLLGGTKYPIRLCYFAKILYPDRFEDLDAEAFHQEYLEKYQGLEFKGIYVYPCPWAE